MSRLRLRAQAGGRGAIVDLKRDTSASIGRQGAGTIHHIAFRARSSDEQRDWRERLTTWDGFGLSTAFRAWLARISRPIVPDGVAPGVIVEVTASPAARA